MFGFLLYCVLGVILHWVIIVYREISVEEDGGRFWGGFIRVCFFLIGIMYWPVLLPLLLYLYIKRRPN